MKNKKIRLNYSTDIDVHIDIDFDKIPQEHQEHVLSLIDDGVETQTLNDYLENECEISIDELDHAIDKRIAELDLYSLTVPQYAEVITESENA